jgi:hypothetical protein
MSTKEQDFVRYYCISVSLMRLAKFNLEMARDFCTHSRIKHTINVSALAMEAKISDMTMRLRTDSRSEVRSDLNSDTLMGIGNILHELMETSNVCDIEKEIVDFIRSKAIKHEYERH